MVQELSTDVEEAVRTLRRHARLGFFAMLGAFALPVLVRAAFGVYTPGAAAGAVLGFVPATALGLVVLLATFRAVLRRGASLTLAGLLSLASTVPVIVVACVTLAEIQRAFPSLEFFGPGDQGSLGYHVVVGITDATAMVAMWAGAVKLPALLQMHEARGREMDALRRDAELLRLRTHLEPHFLLNTMNTIAGLVTEDPMQARELLVALGDLLRDATSSGDEQPLAAEIAWLERYVAIHAARFPGQFTVRWEIDADVRQAKIPSLLLQPLVENALSHGMAQATEGHIAIAARWEPAGDGERNLFLEIRDDGPELGPPRDGGKGLTIVRRRLALRAPAGQTDERASFALIRVGGWTCARVLLREPGTGELLLAKGPRPFATGNASTEA